MVLTVIAAGNANYDYPRCPKRHSTVRLQRQRLAESSR
jgi:hypothetical protein